MTDKEKAEKIELVLDYLRSNNIGCVSDAIQGLFRYPMSGSDEDLKIKIIERTLIDEGLVLVTEEGNTNSTINGYYYFALSPKGAEVLLAKKSVHQALQGNEEIKSLRMQIEKLTKENLVLQNKSLRRNAWQFWVGLGIGGLITGLIQWLL